ncbi:translation initiation factor eIF2B subunit [Scheffersomyces amazonensis]|uniref:translation initiation factor eIF2B subunit n=1 Tax=Scheffersomyces amazonensis TaxID=1078765 RepID=UPI00315C9A98
MEFHAVIVCGSGKSLSPFSRIRSTGTPKALLPIANRPMIDYVLEWCEKAFFPRVTIVADSDCQEEIERAIGNFKVNYAKVKQENADESGVDSNDGHNTIIDVLPLDTDNTGEILLHLYKSSSSLDDYRSFVILPCDFITNLPPQVLIEAYRNKEDSDVGLLVTYYNQLDIEDKKSKIFPKNYTIYSELSDGKCQLLDMYSNEDIDFHKALQIRTQMCWRHGNSTISTKLLNSGIFFGSKDAIFKIFDENPDKVTDSYFKNRPITKIVRDLGRRSWRHSSAKETIGCIVLPQQATFFRNNNLPVLMEANRYFMKAQAIAKATQGSGQPQKDKTAANVGIDSLVGDNTTLGERTNVKRSVVGSNCIIGKRVKLTGCLILNNVTIDDDVQLENCIIGNNAIIHSKSRLTNCNVESTNEVVKGTQAKGETLLCLSLEGLVEDESALSEEEESSETDESGSDFSDDYDAEEDEYAGNEDGLFAY